jgi:DNA mismatch endonuclease Vsr
MADTLTPEARSERMSRIRGKNTGPEWTVRRVVHALGYRYRLHDKRLPGRPDLVFPSRRKVIFVWFSNMLRCVLKIARPNSVLNEEHKPFLRDVQGINSSLAD